MPDLRMATRPVSRSSPRLSLSQGRVGLLARRTEIHSAESCQKHGGRARLGTNNLATMPSSRGRLPSVESSKGQPPSGFVEDFRVTMPERYKLLYREEEVRLHAAIAWRRGSEAIHLEQLPGQDAAWWLCAVTDDRPALLSMLSAAITAHSLDILSARIYCRARSSQDVEAVDFFCIRRLKPPPGGRLDQSELAQPPKNDGLAPAW